MVSKSDVIGVKLAILRGDIAADLSNGKAAGIVQPVHRQPSVAPLGGFLHPGASWFAGAAGRCLIDDGLGQAPWGVSVDAEDGCDSLIGCTPPVAQPDAAPVLSPVVAARNANPVTEAVRGDHRLFGEGLRLSRQAEFPPVCDAELGQPEQAGGRDGLAEDDPQVEATTAIRIEDVGHEATASELGGDGKGGREVGRRVFPVVGVDVNGQPAGRVLGAGSVEADDSLGGGSREVAPQGFRCVAPVGLPSFAGRAVDLVATGPVPAAAVLAVDQPAHGPCGQGAGVLAPGFRVTVHALTLHHKRMASKYNPWRSVTGGPVTGYGFEAAPVHRQGVPHGQ